MKRLSTSYAEYYKQLEIASEKLLAEYPEIKIIYFLKQNDSMATKDRFYRMFFHGTPPKYLRLLTM